MTDRDEDVSSHYLDILNKHLTSQQLSLPEVRSCTVEDTLTGPLYTLSLRIRDLALERIGRGNTKKEAKNNAARDLVAEIEKLKASQVAQPRIIGQRDETRIKKNAVAKLHEFVQKFKMAKPSYQVLEKPAGARSDFLLEVCVGSYTAQGRGSSKKVAKLACSKEMLRELRREKLGEEEEEEESGESQETPEEEEEKEAVEEAVTKCLYADLDEFQGVVRNQIVSEYADLDTGHQSFSLVNVDLPPDQAELAALDMNRSQVIEDTSDPFPVPYEICQEWRFANILLEKAAQMGDINVTFHKLKQVDNRKRSFLVFLKILPDNPDDSSQQYLNMSHGYTLKIATESVALITLKHAEILGCNLSQLPRMLPHSTEDLESLVS